MKLDVKEFTLIFKPSVLDSDKRFIGQTFYHTNGSISQSTTRLKQPHDCNIDLKFKFDEEHSWDWCVTDMTKEQAKIIYDISTNEAMCALHLANVDDVIKKFAKIKSLMFLKVVPQNNYDQYIKWLDMYNKNESDRINKNNELDSIWHDKQQNKDWVKIDPIIRGDGLYVKGSGGNYITMTDGAANLNIQHIGPT